MRKGRVDALTLKPGPTISGVTVTQEGARTVHEVTEIAPPLAITLEFPEQQGTSRPSEFPEGTEINASVRNPYRDESSPNYIPEGTAVNLYVHRLQPDEDPDDDNLLFQVEGSMGSDGLVQFESQSSLNYKANEEGCELVFIARAFEDDEEEMVEAISERVRMQALNWDKFDIFFNSVVNCDSVVYGPGWGRFEPQSESVPEHRWVVTARGGRRGDSFEIRDCDTINGMHVGSTAITVSYPSFHCHTFVNFFLGFWYNYNENYYPGLWLTCQEFLDEFNSNGQCYNPHDGSRRPTEDDSDKHGYREYVERRMIFSEQGGSFTHVYDNRYKLGVINVVTYLENNRHTMILYKRNGRLYRMAADGSRRSDGAYNAKPIAYRETERNWFTGSNVDVGQTNNHMTVWRIKPLREEGQAPQVGGSADNNQLITRIDLEDGQPTGNESIDQIDGLDYEFCVGGERLRITVNVSNISIPTTLKLYIYERMYDSEHNYDEERTLNEGLKRVFNHQLNRNPPGTTGSFPSNHTFEYQTEEREEEYELMFVAKIFEGEEEEKQRTATLRIYRFEDVLSDL